MANIRPIRSMDSGGNGDDDVHDHDVDGGLVHHVEVFHLEDGYLGVYCLED